MYLVSPEEKSLWDTATSAVAALEHSVGDSGMDLEGIRVMWAAATGPTGEGDAFKGPRYP
jgi:hypothetical protein